MTLAMTTFTAGDRATLQHDLVGWDHSKRPGLIAVGETVIIDQVWRVEGGEHVYCHICCGDLATWVEGSEIAPMDGSERSEKV